MAATRYSDGEFDDPLEARTWNILFCRVRFPAIPIPSSLCEDRVDMTRRRSQGSSLEIDGYSQCEMVGRGATSAVYKAWDDELNRWVAIKVLLEDSPGDPARKRFRRERTITANLGKHPHIVQILDTGFTDDGLPFVVMEFYERGSVADQIERDGPLSVSQTLDIGVKVAEALGAAHSAGILHRDVKPRNILLSEYGPALADFGIARSATNLEWSTTLAQFTPMHAAPEVLDGDSPTTQSDIYSLGSSLYTMLAGKAPFAGPDGESLVRFHLRVVEQPVPELLRSDIPTELFAALQKSLAKEPIERFKSAKEFRDTLAAVPSLPSTQRSPWAPPEQAPQLVAQADLSDSSVGGGSPETTMVRTGSSPTSPEPNMAAMRFDESAGNHKRVNQWPTGPKANFDDADLLGTQGEQTIVRGGRPTSAERSLLPSPENDRHLPFALIASIAAVCIIAIAALLLFRFPPRAPATHRRSRRIQRVKHHLGSAVEASVLQARRSRHGDHSQLDGPTETGEPSHRNQLEGHQLPPADRGSEQRTGSRCAKARVLLCAYSILR